MANHPRHTLLDTLPALVAAECARRRISQRTAARDLGLSPSTVTRIIQGKGCDAYALLLLIPWLGLTVDWLSEPTAATNAYQRGRADYAARLRELLDDHADHA